MSHICCLCLTFGACVSHLVLAPNMGNIFNATELLEWLANRENVSYVTTMSMYVHPTNFTCKVAK